MKTIEGREVPEKFLTVLDEDEKPVFAAYPDFTTVIDGLHMDDALLLLSDRRMLILRGGLFKPKKFFAEDWTNVHQVSGQPWNGGGPKIQFFVTADHPTSPIELIVKPQFAVEVESAIRNGYLSVRSPD